MKKTIGELKRMSSPWLFVWETLRQRQKSLGKTNPWRALQCPLTSSPMFLLTMLQRKFAKLDDKKCALYETPKYKMVGFFFLLIESRIRMWYFYGTGRPIKLSPSYHTDFRARKMVSVPLLFIHVIRKF